MTTIRDVAAYLEQIAPPALAEHYDNVGLLCGDAQQTVQGIMTCLDVTPEVLEEAHEKGCNLIVAHHPIIFGGVKKLTPTDIVGRTLITAIQRDMAIYAIHTNLDAVLRHGVNEMLANRLGWPIKGVLAPRQQYIRCVIDVPTLLRKEMILSLEEMRDQLTDPYQLRIEEGASHVVVTTLEHMHGRLARIVDAHKGELYSGEVIQHGARGIGSGILVELGLPISEEEALGHLATVLKVPAIKHTPLLGRSVARVALCGGSGSFLLGAAKAAKADLFITADYKYHQFFDADGDLVIVDVGHYESEQFTADGLQALLSAKFTNFASLCTSVVTNPVHYFIHKT